MGKVIGNFIEVLWLLVLALAIGIVTVFNAVGFVEDLKEK